MLQFFLECITIIMCVLLIFIEKDVILQILFTLLIMATFFKLLMVEKLFNSLILILIIPLFYYKKIESNF